MPVSRGSVTGRWKGWGCDECDDNEGMSIAGTEAVGEADEEEKEGRCAVAEVVVVAGAAGVDGDGTWMRRGAVGEAREDGQSAGSGLPAQGAKWS